MTEEGQKGREWDADVHQGRGDQRENNQRVGRIKGTGGRWEIKGESHREDERKEMLMR